MTRKRMYDPKCEELAEHFLQDERMSAPEWKQELAQCIQDAIEDWFEGIDMEAQKKQTE